MIKRFTLATLARLPMMKEMPDGDYVRYEDYDKLDDQLAKSYSWANKLSDKIGDLEDTITRLCEAREET